MLSHLEAFLYLWGIFFVFQYVFMCVYTQFFTKGKFLPWSLKPEVQCLLLFESSCTGGNPELLVFSMDYEWKTGDFTDSKASRDHSTLLTKVSVTPS